MCDFETHGPLPPLANDEYVVDTARVRGFIDGAREHIRLAQSPSQACQRLSSPFAELLADPDWLPASFQAPAPASGMGGGIGQWLIFRSADRSLALFSLVVPPGAMTPVHDHLAWGLVGVYRGSQDEEFYRPGGGRLELVRQRPLRPGDFYTLLPPRDDVHRVRTTSDETSVSIHLLASDVGCVWRHTFDEHTGEPQPFRSGYVNAECVRDESEDRASVS
jgi:predicted metal-dependent enzyme (double-stranded beta helix superfamily)